MGKKRFISCLRVDDLHILPQAAPVHMHEARAGVRVLVNRPLDRRRFLERLDTNQKFVNMYRC
jgi:hypothetical protein